jgi:HEAT repeat protein
VLALQVLFSSLAAVLLLLGVWLVLRALVLDRSRGRRRCPRCWYELGALQTRKCPECGKEATSERALLRTRRSPRAAAAAVTCIVAGLTALRGPQAVREGSGWALLPTPIILLLLQVHPAAEDDVLQRATAPGAKLTALEQYMAARVCARMLAGPVAAEEQAGAQRNRWLQRRSAALQLMPQLGYGARAATPALVAMLESTRDADAVLAVQTLAQMGSAAEEAVPAMAKLVTSEDFQLRLATVRALAELKARPRLAIPVLLEQAKKDPVLARSYVRSISGYERDGVPALVELLEIDRPDMRQVILSRLIAIGGHDRALRGRIVDLLARERALGLTNILWGLGKAEELSAYKSEVVREVYQRTGPKERIAILMWFASKTAWPEPRAYIMRGLRDDDPEVRRETAEFFSEHDPRRPIDAPGRFLRAGGEVLQTLRRMAREDPDERVREEAALAVRLAEQERAGPR